MVAATIRKIHAPNHEAAVLRGVGVAGRKFAVHFHAPDKPDDRADGVYQFRAGVEIRTHHRGGFVDARDAVSLRESGGGCGDDKCRRED